MSDFRPGEVWKYPNSPERYTCVRVENGRATIRCDNGDTYVWLAHLNHDMELVDSGDELEDQLRASLKEPPPSERRPVAGEVRITDPVTGGQKGQKPERYDLLPYESLDEVARVYGYGARKYPPHNWRRGYAWGLSLGALVRHVARFIQGESIDPESGCHHMGHAAFHCLTLIAFDKGRLGTDDRAQQSK
jgi:hypothetical protein